MSRNTPSADDDEEYQIPRKLSGDEMAKIFKVPPVKKCLSSAQVKKSCQGFTLGMDDKTGLYNSLNIFNPRIAWVVICMDGLKATHGVFSWHHFYEEALHNSDFLGIGGIVRPIDFIDKVMIRPPEIKIAEDLRFKSIEDNE